ncbi:MAG: DUF4867 family protein [Eubacteriales bacterium]|nr:DUF4867 family protein [Eubacteriales bacterium]
MKIYSVTDKEFNQFGRVVTGMDISELLEVTNILPVPEDVIYVPSDRNLESLGLFKDFSKSLYGGMDIQIGYCNGHNNKLNALEYHRSSEINIAATDMILMLGRRQDIEEDWSYDTSKVLCFKIPKGTIVELYATTLHYAPCGVDGDGFKCIVILPKGTNVENVHSNIIPEDKLLAASNKWLIAHKDAGIEGAFVGLKGENIKI